jgi:flagellar basal body-associated protein FliL
MADTRSRRNAPIAVTIALVVLSVLLVVAAVIYFSNSAGSLPAFFPGHQSGSTHHHTKHGIAAIVVAVVCLVAAWIASGRRTPAEK